MNNRINSTYSLIVVNNLKTYDLISLANSFYIILLLSATITAVQFFC